MNEVYFEMFPVLKISSLWNAKSWMGAVHKMAPVGVCGGLLHMGPCWMYGWLRAAEKNSPSESYFLLLLLEYA